MEGTVKQVVFIAPHSIVYLDVKDAKADTAIWALEATEPAGILNNGVEARGRASRRRGQGALSLAPRRRERVPARLHHTDCMATRRAATASSASGIDAEQGSARHRRRPRNRGGDGAPGGWRGFAVAVNYRSNSEAAAKVVADIEASGGRAVAIGADVAVEADVVRLFEECDRSLGTLSALVNSAGIIEKQMRVDGMDTGRLQRVFATNVFGPFLCSREAVRRMSTRHGGPGGSIVNVSSLASVYGSPNEYVDYAATKGAVDTLTTGLAREVATEGIRVNVVRAGHIYTEFHALGGEPDRVDRVKADVPMKRGGLRKRWPRPSCGCCRRRRRT